LQGEAFDAALALNSRTSRVCARVQEALNLEECRKQLAWQNCFPRLIGLWQPEALIQERTSAKMPALDSAKPVRVLAQGKSMKMKMKAKRAGTEA
jgi:hypothetical protein